jgi:hypothetical protein
MSAATVNILVAPWFDRRQGMAVSLAFTGASGGGVVIAPGLLWLFQRLGFDVGLRVAVVIMLTLAMLAVTGVVAVVVYEWVGLAFLRRSWINLDLLWTAALIATGVVLLV